MSAVVQLERPISGLAAALAKAQLEIQNPPLDSMNPHFRSRFASLPGVRNSIVPIMAKHGIAVTQDLKNAPGGVSCTTILTHVSGEQMVFGPLEMPATKQDAQGLGSAATYARRYGLLAAACVAGEEDDDGGAPAEELVTAQQVADLDALLDEVKANKAAFMKVCKVESLDQMLAKNYAEAVKRAESKRSA
jgi:hypothetical protein